MDSVPERIANAVFLHASRYGDRLSPGGSEACLAHYGFFNRPLCT
jgi:hypothetical protein